MPNRVLREALLNSERYWSLSTDSCRMLFTHLVLRADDFGLFRASNYTIRATCFGVDAPSPKRTAEMLAELAKQDLIRLYKVDGAEYGIIPRYGQRLRIVKARYPLPPPNIRDNDINELISKMTDIRPTHDRHPSAEVKRKEVEVESEKKRISIPNVVQNPHGTARPKDHNPNNVSEKKNESKSNGKSDHADRWDKTNEGIEGKAKELGIQAHPGENHYILMRRCWTAINLLERSVKPATIHPIGELLADAIKHLPAKP